MYNICSHVTASWLLCLCALYVSSTFFDTALQVARLRVTWPHGIKSLTHTSVDNAKLRPRPHVARFFRKRRFFLPLLRWLEIVSWRARPCSWLRVLARVHQAHAGANLTILYPRKFCKIYISIENISESWRWKFKKIGTVVKNGQKFLLWSKEKIL